MAAILGMGVATFDIVNEVPTYPAEDGEVRAGAQRLRRGGNTANTLDVLAQLGHACAWAGVWADEPDGRWIIGDLEARGVRTDTAVRVAPGKSPTSYITLASDTGSRTIVHFRDLPELAADDLAAIDVTAFRWVHLEVRPNTREVTQMQHLIRERSPRTMISLEVEKPREGLEHCLHDPDVVLFAGDYARAQGFAAPEAFLRSLDPTAVPGVKVCTWGEEGAAAVDNGGRMHRVAAQPPEQVVDTVGAGDTFHAGIIDALVHGRSVENALVAGSRLAGRKCGQFGLDGVVASGP
ncbi:PfkB family carbohydrate kinase [Thiohalorhabdus sp.]|uniref:PfkB family carbohydrate kinase n=1 Tax=Thiohalorhabdus sp. TaxID=3094134 RepID=UPI002FC337A6